MVMFSSTAKQMCKTCVSVMECVPLNACPLEVFFHRLKIMFSIFYVVATQVLGQTEEHSSIIIGWS
jgi:hypothetical protein